MNNNILVIFHLTGKLVLVIFRVFFILFNVVLEIFNKEFNMSNCPENHSSHHIHHEHRENALLEHHDTAWDEIICHLPYAIFSVAIAMIVLNFIPLGHAHAHAHAHAAGCCHSSMAYRLFHTFHFLHLLFAGAGTVLTFRRYAKGILGTLLVGLLVPTFFCTLSDALLPYIGGLAAGLTMEMHWCFLSHLDTVLPFLVGGILCGWIMSGHHVSKQQFYSTWSHFFHIFISSMASILYLVSFGFNDWWQRMGFIFIYAVLVVLIPCTLADIVVPMACAKFKKK